MKTEPFSERHKDLIFFFHHLDNSKKYQNPKFRKEIPKITFVNLPQSAAILYEEDE